MRVFDYYFYNIIEKVKFKDTKKYIEQMLEELGLCYQNISFNMKYGPVEKVVEKYPALAKYRCLEDETRPAAQSSVNEMLTSYSPNWEKGEIYADAKDHEVLAELFTKIPRPFNISSNIVLSGIDWYGGDNLTPAIEYHEICGKRLPGGPQYISCNEIMLERGLDYGNRLNRVIVSVEATTTSVPRGTLDIAHRLEPYLGEFERVSRVCRLSKEELKRNKELEGKYRKKMEPLFQSVAESRCPSPDTSPSLLIPKIAEKKRIMRAFRDTGFEMGSRKELAPGMNRMVCTDSHNYKYEIVVYRGSNYSNSFNFTFRVMGCDFIIAPFIPSLYVESEEEAEQIITKLAKLCVWARDAIGEEMAAEFLDTPEWYWENRSQPDW